MGWLVLHYTGLPTAAVALDRLTHPESGVSAHYSIDEDGTIYRHVPEERRAWHAGRGAWRDCRDLNSHSVGIELVNPGHEWGYRPFPEAQIVALERLASAVMARHRLGPAQVLAHSDLAPDRKMDPGELFPWPRLAAAGIGAWPAVMAADRAAAAAATGAAADESLLRAWGYDTASYGLGLCLTAFRRRYHPQALPAFSPPDSPLSGPPLPVPAAAVDPVTAAETRARLCALLRQWPGGAAMAVLLAALALVIPLCGPGQAATPQRTQPGHIAPPLEPVAPPPVVSQPQRPSSPHEVLHADKPWRSAGSLDRKLSDACAKGQFRERIGLQYRARFKDGILGVARGNGTNLKDPGHLADPKATYLFFAGDSTWCQVLKLKDDAATPLR